MKLRVSDAAFAARAVRNSFVFPKLYLSASGRARHFSGGCVAAFTFRVPSGSTLRPFGEAVSASGSIGWAFEDLLLLGLAVLFGGLCFLSALQGWRRWSENRRLRKHFRH